MRVGNALPALADRVTARIQSGLFHAIENRFDHRIQEHKRRKYECWRMHGCFSFPSERLNVRAASITTSARNAATSPTSTQP